MMPTGLERAVRRMGLLTAASLGFVVWGCEGGHFFAPVTVGPQITDLSAPSSVESGDTLAVTIRALGLIRVDSIVATLRVGSFEQTQTAIQTGIFSDFSAGFDFPVPAAASDTLGVVEAYAVDAQNNVGTLSAITVRTIDTAPPTVSLSLDSPTIGVGTQIDVLVTALDNIGLAEVGFRILDPVGETLAEVRVAEQGPDVVRSLLYTVPPAFPLGAAAMVGIAVDHAGLVTTSAPVAVNFTDIDIPDVEVLTPLEGVSEPGEMPLFTRVRIHDNDAVDSVRVDGVAHRGSRTLGTDTVVVRFLPSLVSFVTPISDTILQRNLAPAGDSTKENAFIRAVAYDRHGNMTRDSVEISLLIDEVPPFVEIRTPVVNAVQGVGDSLLVETFIRELSAPIRSGVSKLELEGLAFRGDAELGTFFTVERFTKRTVTLDPPELSDNGLLVRRYLPATADLTSENVHIIATAMDAWGNTKADTVRIRVVHDTIAPTIVINQPPAGSLVTAGDSVFVSATVFEPAGIDQSGVASINFDGVSYRMGTQVAKYFPSLFPLFPPLNGITQGVWLQPTGDLTLEDAWLRVIARDGLGNVRLDSVRVTLIP